MLFETPKKSKEALCLNGWALFCMLKIRIRERGGGMQIINKAVKDLIPYENNPRKNDKAVKYVAESIKQFGFRIPIIIDKDNVIVAGHTRLKAAKRLKLKEVPCVVADDLTEEQIKAFRVADNKVAEKSEWDFEILDLEIESLPDFNFEDFGFEFDEEEEAPEAEAPKEKKNERLRTDEAYNLPSVNLNRCEGFYQMPILYGEDYIPENLIGFNYAMTAKDKNTGIHFYIDDYQFERIWNSPEQYIDILSAYDCVLTPDFSLYMDMPLSMKIWNTFRSRLIGQMMQDAGIRVIPTVSWAEKETFAFCFDGLPEESVLSISTIGVKKDTEAFEIWKAGTTELLKRKKPKALIVYGGEVEFDYGKTKVYYFSNAVTERMRKGKKNEDIAKIQI